MLTPDEIEDIITDLSCRNAAGGIYTGSVHPFARAVEKAARREAMEQIAQWLEISDAPLTRREAAHAIRELMESGA